MPWKGRRQTRLGSDRILGRPQQVKPGKIHAMVGVFHPIAREPFGALVAKGAPAGLKLAVVVDPVHTDRRFHFCCAEFLQSPSQRIQGAATVANVIDHKDMPSRNGFGGVQAHFDVPGRDAVEVGFIGTTTAERGFHGDRAGEQQIGKEKDPASQDAEGQRLPAALSACGFGPGTEGQPQLVDLPPDFRGTGEGGPVIGDLSAGNAGVVGVLQGDPESFEMEESG